MEGIGGGGGGLISYRGKRWLHRGASVGQLGGSVLVGEREAHDEGRRDASGRVVGPGTEYASYILAYMQKEEREERKR